MRIIMESPNRGSYLLFVVSQFFLPTAVGQKQPTQEGGGNSQRNTGEATPHRLRYGTAEVMIILDVPTIPLPRWGVIVPTYNRRDTSTVK
jgi:hypothetical protein